MIAAPLSFNQAASSSFSACGYSVPQCTFPLILSPNNSLICKMSLKLYIDWLSQPSRFAATVLDILRVPHEIVEVRIGEGKQRTEEYAKVNQFKKVPAISDNGFNLAESHTIVRYVIRSRNIQTDLYPLNDLKRQAKIDEYLDYHHTNTRKCSQLFFNLVIAPRLGIETAINIEQARKEVEAVLRFIDQKILGGNQYVCGGGLTLADLSAYCEIFQLNMIKYDFSKFPNIQSWSKRLSELPEIQRSHTVANKVVKKQQQSPKL